MHRWLAGAVWPGGIVCTEVDDGQAKRMGSLTVDKVVTTIVLDPVRAEQGRDLPTQRTIFLVAQIGQVEMGKQSPFLGQPAARSISFNLSPR